MVARRVQRGGPGWREHRDSHRRWLCPGRSGSAFSFSGFDQYAKVPASAQINVGTAEGFTVEAWINPSSLRSPIVEWNGGIVRGELGVHFYISAGPGPGCLYANFIDTLGQNHTLASSANLVQPNQFQHVALTYSKVTGGAAMYLNGTAVVMQGVGSFTPQTSYPLFIGFQPLDLVQFLGKIDEVSLYRRALLPTEISAIWLAGAAGKCGWTPAVGAPVITTQPQTKTVDVGATTSFTVAAQADGPMFYQWRFKDADLPGATTDTLILSAIQPVDAGAYTVAISNGAGTVISDAAVLTVHGEAICVPVPSGLVSWWRAEFDTRDTSGPNDGAAGPSGVGFQSGAVGEAFELDGIGQRVLVPASSSLNVGSGPGLTIEGWIKPASTAGQPPVLEWSSPGTLGVHIYLSVFPPSGGGAGCLYANLMDASGRSHLITSSGGLIVDNHQYHIAVTYDKAAGSAALYVNGGLITRNVLGSFAPSTGADLNLGFGRATGSDSVFAGQLDEVSLYGRALSDEEIRGIFRAGSSGKCGPPPELPSITTQPASRTIIAGEGTTLTVVAAGTRPLSYQWLHETTSIPGAVSASLNLNNVQSADAGPYRVTVSNRAGSITSDPATLTVTPNTAPFISNIPGPMTDEDVAATVSVGFGDAETPAAQLGVHITSTSPSLLPPGNIVWTTSGNILNHQHAAGRERCRHRHRDCSHHGRKRADSECQFWARGQRGGRSADRVGYFRSVYLREYRSQREFRSAWLT